MKTFEVPISDCGCFIVGEIGPDVFDPPPNGKAYPKFGIIIWYESSEAVGEAAGAACAAHWKRTADRSPPVSSQNRGAK